ncbi:MAG: hypothetical protein K5765_01730 [Clostridia bacterium]|nr:hypothetical protein [Clostridia bacterium]
MSSVESYVKYIGFVEASDVKLNDLKKAVKYVVKNKPESLAANDKFSNAISEQVNFHFEAKDYGITKIGKLVKKITNTYTSEFVNFNDLIISEINRYLKCKTLGDISIERETLDIDGYTNDIIMQHYFGSDRYTELDYMTLKTAINSSNSVFEIIQCATKIRISDFLKSISSQLDYLPEDINERIGDVDNKEALQSIQEYVQIAIIDPMNELLTIIEKS